MRNIRKCIKCKRGLNSPSKRTSLGSTVGRVSVLQDRELPGSLPGGDIPKGLEMVLAASYLALGFSG